MFPKQLAALGNLLEMQIFRPHIRSKSQKLSEWGPVIVLNSDTDESLRNTALSFLLHNFFAATHKYLQFINLSINT